MDPAQQTILKALIAEAVKSGTEGMIPLSVALMVCGVVCTSLITAIGTLFVWIRSLTRQFAEKIEELARAREEREDKRDEAHQKVIDREKKDASEREQKLAELLKRKDEAKDLARSLMDKRHAETEEWMKNNLGDLRQALVDATEVQRLVLDLIESKGK